MKPQANLIAGEWKSSENIFSTQQGDFCEAGTEAVNEAAEAAATAFLTTSRTPPEKRIDFLTAIAEELENIKTELLKYYCAESKLPQGRAEGEFSRTIGQINHFVNGLKTGRYLSPVLDVRDGSPDLRKINFPIGPIAVFGASNFPLAFSTAGGDTVSAFAAGCPVVVKAHPYHPKTSNCVAVAINEAVRKCQFPAGTFSHLQGVKHQLGREIVSHPCIKGVGFTGSFSGGMALTKITQQRHIPIPVFAEMGSVNPMFLFPKALHTQKDLPEKIGNSIALGCGQFCTNPGLIIACGEEADLNEFEYQLATHMSTQAFQPMVHETIYSSFQKQLEDRRKEQQLYGNNNASLGVTQAEPFLQNSHWAEEVFGPYSLLVKCQSLKQMHSVLTALEGQLTLSLIGEKEDQAAIAEILPLAQQKAGRILFDGVPTGVAVSQAMMHGGPFPASTDARFTAVGGDAIMRWVRPISFQDCPENLLPSALQSHNPLELTRTLNGIQTKDKL